VRQRTDGQSREMVAYRVVSRAHNPSKRIGEIIDDVERIREELLRLQRELEKMESPQSVLSTKRAQKELARDGER
jgi:predicted translin family RNA/ssDNA-binding protein